MAREKLLPACLGKIHERYDHKCAITCSSASLCTLIAMGDYPSSDKGISPTQDLTEPDKDE